MPEAQSKPSIEGALEEIQKKIDKLIAERERIKSGGKLDAVQQEKQ